MTAVNGTNCKTLFRLPIVSVLYFLLLYTFAQNIEEISMKTDI